MEAARAAAIRRVEIPLKEGTGILPRVGTVIRRRVGTAIRRKEGTGLKAGMVATGTGIPLRVDMGILPTARAQQSLMPDGHDPISPDLWNLAQ